MIVPGEEYATLQAAFDGLPSGSVIQLRPGLYREALVLDGKALTILGSTAGGVVSEIAGPSPASDVVTLRGEASLSAWNLVVSGGQNGIVGEPPQVPGAQAPRLQGTELSLLDSQRGAFGRFEALMLDGGVVGGHGHNGISVFGVRQLRMVGVQFHSNKNVGLFLDERDMEASGSPSHVVWGCTFEDNENGGIDVWGSAVRVGIFRCTLARNGLFGVQLDEADGAIVDGCHISGSTSNALSQWGDGVDVFVSEDVLIRNNVFDGNWRAAVAAYGCPDEPDGGPTSVDLRGNRCTGQRLDLVTGPAPACDGDATNWFRELISNTCDGVPCRVKPSFFAPAPPPHVP